MNIWNRVGLALLVVLTGFALSTTSVQSPAKANLASCFKVVWGQWVYTQPGACATPLPLKSPTPHTPTWSQQLLINQGLTTASYGSDYGLNNYIHLFSDAAPSFSPTPISYSILGGDSNLNSQLYEDSAGVYFLALWQNQAGQAATQYPPYQRTTPTMVGENISVEVAGTTTQIVGTSFNPGSGLATNFYIEPTSCASDYCYAATVNTGLLVMQIGPRGFNPIPPYNKANGQPTSNPTGGPTTGPTTAPTVAPTTTPTATPTPSPGPVILTPPTLAPFSGPTAAPTTADVYESYYTGPFSAVSANGAIATATMLPNGLTVKITPVSPGTTSFTVTGAQATSVPIVVNATPTPTAPPSGTPTPSYNNPTPMGNALPLNNFPITIASLPINTHSAISAIVNAATNTAASNILGGVATFSLNGGRFDGSTNGGTSTDNHFFDAIGGAQASPTLNFTANQTYFVAGQTDGTNVINTVCRLPYTTNNCVQYTTPDTASWTAGNIVAYIGAASDGTSRIMPNTASTVGGNYIWDVQAYAVGPTLTQWNAIAGFAPAANPYPTPTATPTSGPTTPPPTNTLSSRFYGKTPFHYTVAQLLAAGGHVCTPAICGASSAAMAANFISEPITANHHYDQIPIWVTPNASTPVTYITCSSGNVGGCPNHSTAAQPVHAPPGAAAQCLLPTGGGNCTYDYHIAFSDTFSNYGENAGWGGSPSDGRCALSGTNWNCIYNAVYLFQGSGLSIDQTNHYAKANRAGYAYDLFQITAQDLTNAANGGEIAHALGIVTECEGNALGSGGSDTANNWYPSLPGNTGTDSACGANGNAGTPNTVYGSLVHYIGNLNPTGASIDCKNILKAANKYGIYTTDNTSYPYGIDFLWNNYAADNQAQWNAVMSRMNAAGESSGSGMTWSSNMCWNYIKAQGASAIEIIQINQGGTAALP